jgi:hypothetical protein
MTPDEDGEGIMVLVHREAGQQFSIRDIGLLAAAQRQVQVLFDAAARKQQEWASLQID